MTAKFGRNNDVIISGIKNEDIIFAFIEEKNMTETHEYVAIMKKVSRKVHRS